jgi:hypothetical protein
MAIDAEVFPVGAIRRVILRIAVLVMHSQKLSISPVKFPAALGAHQAMNLQGTLPIIAVHRDHKAFPP